MGMMSEAGKDIAYGRVLEMIDDRLKLIRDTLAFRSPKKWAQAIKELEQLRRLVVAAQQTLD